MFRVPSHQSTGAHKTVTTASGTGHNVGVDSAFRGQQYLLLIIVRDATKSSLFIY